MIRFCVCSSSGRGCRCGPVAFVGVRGEDFTSITRKGERLVRQIVKEAEI